MIPEEESDVSRAMAVLILRNAELERSLSSEKRKLFTIENRLKRIERDILELRPNYYNEKRAEFFKDVVSAPCWDWQKLVKKDESEDASPEAE